MHEGDIGFDKDKTMFVELENSEDLAVFSKTVQQIAGVSTTSTSQDHLGVSLKIHEVELDIEKIQTKFFEVSQGYFSTIGARLTMGRFFLASDDHAIVITERLRALLNLEDPIGNRLKIGDASYSIVGVVEDLVDRWYLFDDFNKMPMVFALSTNEEDDHFLIVRTANDDSDRVYTEVRNTWNRLYPAKPFLGDTQVAVLQSDRANDLKSVFTFLALMTVLISCTGTYALARQNIEKRLHEMAIRKVFGADIIVLFKLLNREFALILILASTLGCSAGYYLFRQINASEGKIIFVEVTSAPFVFTALWTILLGLLFSCVIIYRHGYRNPVDVLRNQ